MTAILLPFSALLFLVEWQREIQHRRRLLVIALGLYLLINRRHPRFLARVPPPAGAVVVSGGHGPWRGADAGADLSRHLPHRGTGRGPRGGIELMAGNVGIAVIVAVAHTLAMTVSGGVLAVGGLPLARACVSCREAGSTSISSGH